MVPLRPDVMTRLSIRQNYPKMMPIAKRLIVFGIHHPGVASRFRYVWDTMGVGASPVLTPTTRRHSADNVGTGDFLASVLFAFQC